MQVLKYPDTFLRDKSHVVMLPLSEKDRELIEDMCLTMYKENGIGLAATQVDFHVRLVVMDISEDRNDPKIFVNPFIAFTTCYCYSINRCSSN